jgi:hypothetical protein
MDRVDIDELEVPDGSTHLLNGKPFTGVGYENDLDGRLVSEISFVDGIQTGPARDFDPQGNVVLEENYRGGQKHGRSRRWTSDGVLVADELYEFSTVVSGTYWDDLGKPTGTFELSKDSPRFKRLEELRRIAHGESK